MRKVGCATKASIRVKHGKSTVGDSRSSYAQPLTTLHTLLPSPAPLLHCSQAMAVLVGCSFAEDPMAAHNFLANSIAAYLPSPSLHCMPTKPRIIPPEPCRLPCSPLAMQVPWIISSASTSTKWSRQRDRKGIRVVWAPMGPYNWAGLSM